MIFSKINKEIILMKMHYFFGIGAVGPILPFLSVIGKQRGYSAFAMGVVFTTLQIPGLLIRPIVGAITDKYQCRKATLLVSQGVSALAVVALIFMPEASIIKSYDDDIVFHSLLFWIFTCIVTIIAVGTVIRSVLEDTICINILGEDMKKFGKQYLWGSVGWGVMSFISGAINDWQSKGQNDKNYMSGYIISISFFMIDIYISSHIKVIQVENIENFSGDLKNLATNFRVAIFFFSVIAFGFFMSIVWHFLFWYIEDLTTLYYPEGKHWNKTLQGLCIAIQCFLGDVPFFFLSGFIIKKIGHMNVFSISFLIVSLRFFLYSIIKNPVLVLFVEILHGIMYALTYACAISYAASLAPLGAEGTLQGFVGTAFTGIGTLLGNFVGGYLIDKYGSIAFFKILSVIAFVVSIFQVFLSLIIRWKYKNVIPTS